MALELLPLGLPRFVEAASFFIFHRGKAGEPPGMLLPIDGSPFLAEYYLDYEVDMFRRSHGLI